MSVLYTIKEGNKVTLAEPIVGRWYCHFETVTDPEYGKYERSGILAEYEGNGCWVDEDEFPVESMVSEYWPDYLVLQD